MNLPDFKVITSSSRW